MAHIADWRVRETSTSTGFGNIVLAGAMQGSIAFSDVMTTDDTCDYVIHYDDVYEAGLGTLTAGGELSRTTVYRTRHGNGTVDANPLTLPPGVKTVIMDYRANRVPRVDRAQTFTAGEKAQHRANVPPFESGTRMLFQQTTAPVGWTKDTSSHNDKALRLITGTAGQGGSVPFSTLFARTETDGRTLTISMMTPHDHGGATAYGGIDHTHGYVRSNINNVAFNPAANTANQGSSNQTTAGASAWLHTHIINSQGGGQAHSHPFDNRVTYADAIIATAD